MSLNQSHAANGNGVILFNGERLLIFYDGCEFSIHTSSIKGSFNGRVYLTSHRVIFVNKKNTAKLLSFSLPFVNMSEIDIKQPIFGPNRIEGKVTSEPTGGWQGKAEFSLTFNRGGAIEFGQTLIELGKRACSARNNFKPPAPYTPIVDMNGASQYYACPPPVYTPPYNDPYYGFVKPHEAFSMPEGQTLYHVTAPPPYPGAGPAVASEWYNVPYGPGQFAPSPIPSASFNTTGQNEYMTPSHEAKAAEAAASGNNPNNVVTGGYYFPEDPHTVYAQPTAPPYPVETNDHIRDPPPPYTLLNPNSHDKKNQ